MDFMRYARDLLAPFGPRLPLPALVEAVNRLYHSIEANAYDRRHPEIALQLPPRWAEMLAWTLAARPRGVLRVLDFGCGTGFEALQLLGAIPRDRLAALVCYDPSEAMLDICRRKIGARRPAAAFTAALAEVAAHGPYDLLITNSVLHHLPDWRATIAGLHGCLGDTAIWLTGHEPSRRFYRNPACLAELTRLQRGLRWRKYLMPSKYVRRLAERLGLGTSPARAAAARAVAEGLFERAPTPLAIERIVDFSVANSPEEAAAGRGFDYEEMAQELRGSWELRRVSTYGFMGQFFEGDLPRRWREVCTRLQAEHPLDGATFCAVWERAG